MNRVSIRCMPLKLLTANSLLRLIVLHLSCSPQLKLCPLNHFSTFPYSQVPHSTHAFGTQASRSISTLQMCNNPIVRALSLDRLEKASEMDDMTSGS